MSYKFQYTAICDHCGAAIPMGEVSGSCIEIEMDARMTPSTRLPSGWCSWLRPETIWSAQPYHAEFCCREHREFWIIEQFPPRNHALLLGLIQQQDEEHRLEANRIIAEWVNMAEHQK